MTEFYYLHLNPEPWAVGSLSVGKHNGKMRPRVSPNLQLKTTQEAIREELKGQVQKFYGAGEPLALRFWFWRNIDQWRTESGRKSSAHVADVTNLQKGTEDALQGILFANDRDVQCVESVIVEQTDGIEGGIGILVTEWTPSLWAPDPIRHMRDAANAAGVFPSDNSWL